MTIICRYFLFSGAFIHHQNTSLTYYVPYIPTRYLHIHFGHMQVLFDNVSKDIALTQYIGTHICRVGFYYMNKPALSNFTAISLKIKCQLSFVFLIEHIYMRPFL